MIAVVLFLSLQDDAAAKEKAAVEAITKFRATCEQSKDPAVRAAAIAELGKVEHAKVLKVLLGSLSSGEVVVRRASAQALGGWSSLKPEVSKGLVAALALPANAKEFEVLADILDAIGNAGQKPAAAAVMSRADDTNVPVTQAALRAVAKIRTREMIEPLIKQLQDIEQDLSMDGIGQGIPQSGEGTRRKAQQPLVIDALKSITKQSITGSVEWWKWWRDNKAKFKVED